MLALMLALDAVPAGAVVAKIGGHGFGLTPVKGLHLGAIPGARNTAPGARTKASAAPRRFDEPPGGGGPLLYHGGPVMHSTETHVIYWDPNSEFSTSAKEVISQFFTSVAHDSGLASNVFGIAGQYTDTTGNAAYSSKFASEEVDADSYPTTGTCTSPSGSFADPGPPYTKCLYDEQLQQELSSYIKNHSLPKGSNQLYFLLLPHKVVTCFKEKVEGEEACSNNVFCAYHSYINPGTASEIIYADIPFSLLDSEFAKGCQADGPLDPNVQLPNGDRGTSDTETRFADVALKYISHEWMEAITDPLVGVETAWTDGTKEELEIGDKCNSYPYRTVEEGKPGFDKNAFTPTLGGSALAGTLFNQSIDAHDYYLQSEWDNAAKACLMRPLEIKSAAFTFSPTPRLPGSPVSFSGSASDPYGSLEIAWTFGDGGEAVGPSPEHTYTVPGEYTVTMTTKDRLTGSTAAPVIHQVTIQQTQSIAFTSTAPASATVGGPSYTASATATSGLPVSLSSETPSVCSVAGGVVSFLAPGTCTIDANQEGNAEYLAAPQVPQSFAVSASSPGGSGSGSGQGGSAGPSGSSASVTPPTIVPTGEVTLLGAGVSIAANGTGTVKLACAGTATCTGKLTLTIKIKGPGKHARARSVTLASASFSIAPGATGAVTLKLNATGRAQLRAQHGHLGATLTIVKSAPAPQATHTRTVQLKLKPKAKR